MRRLRDRENTTMSTGVSGLRMWARRRMNRETRRTSSPFTVLRSIGPCGLEKPYWYHVALFDKPAVTVCSGAASRGLSALAWASGVAVGGWTLGPRMHSLQVEVPLVDHWMV